MEYTVTGYIDGVYRPLGVDNDQDEQPIIALLFSPQTNLDVTGSYQFEIWCPSNISELVIESFKIGSLVEFRVEVKARHVYDVETGPITIIRAITQWVAVRIGE